MVSRLFRTIRQVIWIDADAVPANETGLKRHEVPFGPRRSQYVAGIDVQRLKDQRQFVHECDIEIALCIFDDLGGFGDLDGRSAMDASGDDRSVNTGHDIECRRILRRDDLHDRLKSMELVTGIDALR